MKSPGAALLRYSEKIAGLIFGGAGAVLLLGMFSHCSPWQMCRIQLHDGGVDIWVPLARIMITVGYAYVPWLLAFFLALPMLLLPSCRRAAVCLINNASRRGMFLPALFIFALTFFPGFFLDEKIDHPAMPARSVALYVTLGLCGVLYLFAGAARRLACLDVLHTLVSHVFKMRLPVLLGSLFVAELALTNLISYCAFEHFPHIQDSLAQIFQGTIFAAGRLTAPSPPLRELFYYEHIINNGSWYSQYPPGHSLFMMLGVLVHAPWIINPLAGSCTVVLSYYLGRELYDDATGRVSAILAFFSPFLLFMSSEFMNHATGLLLFTAFMLLYARTVRLQSIGSALGAGAALGWIVAIRPLTAAGLALPFMAHAAWLLAKRFRIYAPPLLAMSAPVLLWIAAFLAYNYLTNGHPLLLGYQVLHGDAHLPGFGHAPPWGEPLTAGLAVRHALSNLVGLNKYLFEWPMPSLIFIFVLFASGRFNRWDKLLLGSIFSLAAAYFFYWYQDWCFGPRFLYEAATCAILLTARGLFSAPRFLRIIAARPITARTAYGLAAATVIFCTAYGLSSNVPVLYKLYSDRYWLVDATIAREVERQGITNAIIFMRDTYSLMPNSPFLDNGIIYAWDSEKLRSRLMALYPGYRYFFADKDHIWEIHPGPQGGRASDGKR